MLLCCCRSLHLIAFCISFFSLLVAVITALCSLFSHCVTLRRTWYTRGGGQPVRVSEQLPDQSSRFLFSIFWMCVSVAVVVCVFVCVYIARSNVDCCRCWYLWPSTVLCLFSWRPRVVQEKRMPVAAAMISAAQICCCCCWWLPISAHSHSMTAANRISSITTLDRLLEDYFWGKEGMKEKDDGGDDAVTHRPTVTPSLVRAKSEYLCLR